MMMGHSQKQRADAEGRGNAPRQKHLDHQSQELHEGIDTGEEAGLLGAIGKVRGDEPGLLEIEKGADTGKQDHEARDAQKQRRGEEVNRSLERISAQRVCS